MRRLLGVAASALVLGLAGFSLAPTHASAAETHSNCLTFDSNGNIVNAVPSCSETMTLKNQSMSMPGQNPCSGAPGTLSMLVSNQIMHATVNGAGDIWITQTQTGSISFIPTAHSQPSYFGHSTDWFGASLNRSNAVFSNTSNARLRGTDGTTISVHVVGHTSFSATGAMRSFSFGGFSCG